MIDSLEIALDEIKETAKGSAKERLNRLEIGIQEVKKRLSRIEQKLFQDE